MKTTNTKGLHEQQRIAFLLIIWRLPEFFTSFIAATASGSVVLWLEFIEKASILIPGIIIAILSKKLNQNLKYKFNYGTGKVEAITALCCEIFDIAGLFCVSFFALKELFKPEESGSFLLFALAVSILGLLIDLIIMHRQKKILLRNHNKMFHTALVSAQKEFFFDAASISTLIITVVFKNTTWVSFISPVICLAIAVPFFVIIVRHLKESIAELVDRTIDEDSQLKIIKVLNEFYDSYEEFGEVRSRINGNQKTIDIELYFNSEMKYGQVKETTQKIKTRIQEEIDNSVVNVVI